MEITKVVLVSGLCCTLAFGLVSISVEAANAGEVKGKVTKGKVTKTGREGRVVTLGSTRVKISGSRTTVTIFGKEADRAEIKVGMSCTAMVAPHKGKDEAKTISCRSEKFNVCDLPDSCSMPQCISHERCKQ